MRVRERAHPMHSGGYSHVPFVSAASTFCCTSPEQREQDNLI